MTGVAAVAMCAAFTSCSKTEDLYDPGAVREMEIANVYEQYNQAFIKTFGQVNPNVDWGFGKRAGTRAVANVDYVLTEQSPNKPSAPEQPSFSGKPSAPTFNTTVPSGTLKATKANWKDNESFYIDNDPVELENPQNQSNVTIYATGNNVTYQYDTNQNGNGTKIIVTENSTLTLTKVGNNLSIYLAPKATLNVPDGATFKKSGAMLYMSAGSTVNGGNNLTFEENYVALNDGGNLNVKTVTVDGGALLYNDGILTAETNIVLKNTNGELVNSGTITSPSFDQRSGGKFLNDEDGKVTITGMTYLTNTNCVWQNKGSYTTDNVDIENTRTVYNNCKMTVTQKFHFIKNSAFVLDGHASVKTATMDWDDDCDFYMKDESLLWVEGQLLALNDDKGYGAHGLGAGYSIIKAGSIAYQSGKQSRMNYWGNIFVDTDSHFPQGFDDPSNKTTGASQPHYYYSTQNKTVMFKFLNDACPITSPIAAGTCHHGYNPPTPPSTNKVRIMAEDLNAQAEDGDIEKESDWDFNDVVFDVEFVDPTGATSKAGTITLICAGGVLPLRVAGVEVHEKFDSSLKPDKEKGWYPMINTGKGMGINCPQVSFDIADADPENNGLAITIEVEKTLSTGEKVWLPLTARKGNPCSKFAVKPTVDPCLEREHIDFKSDHAFSRYVGGTLNELIW